METAPKSTPKPTTPKSTAPTPATTAPTPTPAATAPTPATTAPKKVEVPLGQGSEVDYFKNKK